MERSERWKYTTVDRWSFLWDISGTATYSPKVTHMRNHFDKKEDWIKRTGYEYFLLNQHVHWWIISLGELMALFLLIQIRWLQECSFLLSSKAERTAIFQLKCCTSLWLCYFSFSNLFFFYIMMNMPKVMNDVLWFIDQVFTNHMIQLVHKS